MRERVSVREVMRREYVGVNEGDPVRGAAELMHADGADCAIVLRGNDPVGVLTATDVLELVAAGEDPEGVTAGERMRQPVISIDVDRPVDDASAMMADRDVRQLVVEDRESIVGLLAEHDLLTANAVFQDTGRARQEVPASVDAATALADASEEDDVQEPYAQGVCEICGSLTAELRDVNGQLVCTDCRSV